MIFVTELAAAVLATFANLAMRPSINAFEITQNPKRSEYRCERPSDRTPPSTEIAAAPRRDNTEEPRRRAGFRQQAPDQ